MYIGVVVSTPASPGGLGFSEGEWRDVGVGVGGVPSDELSPSSCVDTGSGWLILNKGSSRHCDSTNTSSSEPASIGWSSNDVVGWDSWSDWYTPGSISRVYISYMLVLYSIVLNSGNNILLPMVFEGFKSSIFTTLLEYGAAQDPMGCPHHLSSSWPSWDPSRPGFPVKMMTKGCFSTWFASPTTTFGS